MVSRQRVWQKKYRVLRIATTHELFDEVEECSNYYGTKKAEYIREALRRMNRQMKVERLK